MFLAVRQVAILIAAMCVAVGWAGAEGSAGAAPQTASDVDTLILGVEEVMSLVHGGGTLEPAQWADKNAPTPDDWTKDFPPPCNSAFDPSYGGSPVDFRSVFYGGWSNSGIRQTIARYPDPGTAAAAFGARASSLEACAPVFEHAPPGGADMNFVLTRTDANTLLVRDPGSVNGAPSTDVYRLDGPIIIQVSAVHMDAADAYAVLQRIEARVRNNDLAWSVPTAGPLPPVVLGPDNSAAHAICNEGFSMTTPTGWGSHAGRGSPETSCFLTSSVLSAYWATYGNASREERPVSAHGAVDCNPANALCDGTNFLMMCAARGSEVWITCAGGNNARVYLY